MTPELGTSGKSQPALAPLTWAPRSHRATPSHRHRSVLAVVVCAALLGFASGQGETAGALQRLVERLMGPYGYVDFHVELLPGALPDDLPIALQPPAESELVGSMARRDRSGILLGGQVVLDSELGTELVHAHYRSLFAEIGWNPLAHSGPSGFLEPLAAIGAGYCLPATGNVWINTFASGDAPTDIRIDFNLGEEYAYCPVEGSGPWPVEAEAAPLPALTALAGSRVTLHGLSLLPEESSSSALTADLPSGSDLHEHYAAQLQRQGWQRLDDVASEGGVRLSRWTSSDGGWLATLTLSDIPAGTFASLIVVAAN